MTFLSLLQGKSFALTISFVILLNGLIDGKVVIIPDHFHHPASDSISKWSVSEAVLSSVS